MTIKRRDKNRPLMGATKHKWLITDILGALGELLKLQEQIIDEIDRNPRNTSAITMLALRQSQHINEAIQHARDALALIEKAPNNDEVPLQEQMDMMQAQIDDLRKQVETIMNGHFAELLREG